MVSTASPGNDEQAFWKRITFVGLWGGAFVTVGSVGLFGFMEGHTIWGWALTILGVAGLLAMTAFLYSVWPRAVVPWVLGTAIMLTWVMLGSDLLRWTRELPSQAALSGFSSQTTGGKLEPVELQPPEAIKEISNFTFLEKHALRDALMEFSSDLQTIPNAIDTVTSERTVLQGAIDQNSLAQSIPSHHQWLLQLQGIGDLEDRVLALKQDYRDFGKQIDFVAKGPNPNDGTLAMRATGNAVAECLRELDLFSKVTNKSDAGMAGLVRPCVGQLIDATSSLKNWADGAAKRIGAMESAIRDDHARPK